jgi:hypothetical protein
MFLFDFDLYKMLLKLKVVKVPLYPEEVFATTQRNPIDDLNW